MLWIDWDWVCIRLKFCVQLSYWSRPTPSFSPVETHIGSDGLPLSTFSKLEFHDDL